MSTYVENQTLSTVTCAKCAVLFALPETWEASFRKSHETFYCPAGHSNFYPGESNEEKLKREVAQLQTIRERAEARERDLMTQREHLRMQCRAHRGVATRIKNRVKNGVCPCCNRTFRCLADHMKTQHPEYVNTISA